jgi:hypothetical protein
LVFTNWTATCFLGLASLGCGDFLADQTGIPTLYRFD